MIRQAKVKKTAQIYYKQMKDRGTLKVGLMGTYQPYNFLNDKKEMDGFDADIAKEIAKRLGVDS